MKIDSFDNLIDLEKQISHTIKRYKLDHILAGLREYSNKLEPFVIAGVTSFALRNCTPAKPANNIRLLNWNHLNQLAHLVTQYLIADPIVFDKHEREIFNSSNPIFTILRLIGHQLPFSVNLYGQNARSIMLFSQIPQLIAKRQDVTHFLMEENFQKINQVSVTNFINVASIAFSASLAHTGFTRHYFEKAKEVGIDLPPDKEIQYILGNLSAYPEKFKKSYEKYKNKNRLYAMYDFNPLFLYPIIRPWKKRKATALNQDRLVAPIPKLISHRASMGIFYQMFNYFTTKFTNYFGHIFEYYVGEILKNSLRSSFLKSENEIRNTYSSDNGKVPDWVILEGSTALLVECKATRFSRAAVTTGNEEAILDSLKQVLKGLRQLNDFKRACDLKKPGLEFLHKCKKIIPILITFEPLYLINSTFFREYVDDILKKEGIEDLKWVILSVDQLEILQPHLAEGIDIASIVGRLDEESFNELLNELNEKTKKTFKDSFLYTVFEEMYEKFGVNKALKLKNKQTST